MKMTAPVLAMALVAWSAAEADEATDSSCVSAAVGRIPEIPAPTINRTRVSNPARIAGTPEDFARNVAISVRSESGDATYVFLCNAEPGKNVVLRLLGIW
jgi:hypothetical protein